MYLSLIDHLKLIWAFYLDSYKLMYLNNKMSRCEKLAKINKDYFWTRQRLPQLATNIKTIFDWNRNNKFYKYQNATKIKKDGREGIEVSRFNEFYYKTIKTMNKTILLDIICLWLLQPKSNLCEWTYLVLVASNQKEIILQNASEN